MIDPNDFVDQKNAEREESGNPKAGQEGTGGLSTEEAEESYKTAARQHFNEDAKEGNDKKNKPDNEDKNNKTPNPHALPQIGSIQDDEIKVED